MNTKPIDIVVPWVNPDDENWKKDFDYWKFKEQGQKDACRYRDLGVFNFWFRCIEKNMPWIRYVFLILASPSQIPDWLNTDNPKLKIVYHNEFIPNTELPTFNSSVINCYIPFINELSENYILFNDDFFVMKPVEESNYFINDTPLGKFNPFGGNCIGKEPWYHNITNNSTIVHKYFKNKIHFIPDHGPIAFNKNFQLFVHHYMNKDITAALSNSRFRQNKNITDWLFYDVAAITNKMINNKKSLLKFQYVNNPNLKDISEIVCFNDNETLTPAKFDEFRKRIFVFLYKNFPDFCGFEK